MVRVVVGLVLTALHPIGLDLSFGAVAQLGERLICIQEVAGSIPTSSTIVEPLWPEMRANAARSTVKLPVTPSNGPVAQLARAHP